ncbi:MAG: tRNA (adenosine(37)-N6)-threonylcarbamoyltransferase complex dimerization subunit type 1 TsaB [Selenomonas ruminantium]|uniref:tRNA (Adenosine(37)-N6)-threonylcarbamoyltransferase complex dimerization subunit type 1 TsaB n=1 Tax=Selenomonas ruminantium TaxID=971 RepID=A0A927WN18_SELRU|nr:tRNA (adenosine(37)-N6)-threonylcarbamoyltransferase complex dimerization subunit type 1 TsaB [Selenomonas ruminantium]MBE6084489.1 tRNA (adenosine(37)-N6)-threonylcarbamoyltransferase complex dimerization subunit type 1 TsaB [Selenomonas ruminantium]
MSILAIDTATQVSSVAVLKEGRLLAELTMQGKLTHSETLLPHIEQVLEMAAVAKEELTGIAVSNGPGSFTGLRIGLAAAKAMSYVLGIPLVGVSTLQALAYQLPAPGIRIMCLLDAQKGNAYVESYRWENNSLQVVDSVQVAKITDIVAACANMNEQIILLGDAVQKKVAGKLELPANVSVAPPHIVMPRAACVAMLGQAKLMAGETDNVMDLEPVYIRRSEAEVLWEKRHLEEARATKPTEEM